MPRVNRLSTICENSVATTDHVLDASTVIEALTSKSNDAAALRARLTDATCHAPHLLDAEIGSVLRKQVRRGDISAAQAHGLLHAAHALIRDRYPHGPLLDAAWQLRDNLTFYDALYVALAARLKLSLLTADRRLANAPGLPCTIDLI